MYTIVACWSENNIFRQVPGYAIHRLPINFDDPMTFDPGRFAPGKPR